MKKASYLRETVDLVKSIETRFIELGQRLYKIRTKKLYEDNYDSFSEFLDVAHINASLASRLMKIYDVFILQGNKTPQQLAGVGYSNLYESVPLVEKEGVDKALAKASTLTRSEIIDEVKEGQAGSYHVHEPKNDSRFAVCECGKFFIV